MKKTILSLLGIFALTLSVQAQNSTFDPTNAREGESVEYCITHKKRKEMLLNPAAVQSMLQDEQIRAQEALNGTNGAKAPILYIPIVFHLVHNNGAEFITDEQILTAVDILNRDYLLLNPDAANVHNDFNASNGSAQSTPSNVEIQFRLATKAPDGTCFTGITHTVSTATSSGDGTTIRNAVVAGNDVYQGQWNGGKYLNIFIADDIGGAAGYTYTPSNWLGTSMGNGIWVQHDYVGTIGTSSVSSSRTLTHEVGHWLNLSHTWGPNNNPGNAASCNDDDNVNDTPECIGLSSCNLNANSCSGDNGYWGFDIRDNTENYMDYSYCSKMFTQGQTTRMRNALNSSVGGRNNIPTAQNLIDTGADGNLYLCQAEFTANKTTTCTGGSIEFSDASFNVVNGWTWSFAGGSPATSIDENPVITYNTPGLYQVALTATDGTSNDTETKTSYIRVLPAEATLPILEGFESFNTLANIDEWDVYSSSNNNKFDITSSAGHTGSKSAKLGNYAETAGNIDELSSAPVDLSVINGGSGVVTLSFRYAYRKRFAANDEWLKVFVTNDCGDTWSQRKTLHGDLLSPLAVNTAWTPSSQADWVTVHMTNVTSSYWVNNFRYKFRFESDGGNNFFLDDINIYSSAPSDELIAGIVENGEVADLNIYPNPTDGELNVQFSVGNAQEVQLAIQDVTGKIVQNVAVYANEGANLVMLDTQTLASGMYFLNVYVNGVQQAMQFVVK